MEDLFSTLARVTREKQQFIDRTLENVRKLTEIDVTEPVPGSVESEGLSEDGDLLVELATRDIDCSGDWLTRSYSLDERIAIVRLWRLWREQLGPTWTRVRHAQHFHIPEGTLAGWITKYG